MRYKITVCHKSGKYGIPGETIETIERTLRSESIGNFHPIFCRYHNNSRCLVHSTDGDLSDPFRRDEKYLESLYIEV